MAVNAFFIADAWAASSPGAEAHPASIAHLVFPLINFLIFLYLVKRYLLPPIKNHLRSRREEILNAVKEAEEARERVEGLLREYRDRLSRVDEEKKRLLESLRSEGEREKAKLLQEAEGLASRIRADADFVAQQEVKLARHRVRVEIARMAQTAAERIMKSDFRGSDQERLLEQFLRGITETK